MFGQSGAAWGWSVEFWDYERNELNERNPLALSVCWGSGGDHGIANLLPYGVADPLGSVAALPPSVAGTAGRLTCWRQMKQKAQQGNRMQHRDAFVAGAVAFVSRCVRASRLGYHSHGNAQRERWACPPFASPVPIGACSHLGLALSPARRYRAARKGGDV